MATDLFEAAPAAPADWRQPTRGEHVCAGCVGAACFGLHGTWYCRRCVPVGFLPSSRGQG